MSTPPNFRIKALWAFVAIDPEDNSEGIIADLSHPMGPTPMIGADEARIRSLRPIAEEMARQTGITVKLVRFDTRVDEEVIGATDTSSPSQAND